MSEAPATAGGVPAGSPLGRPRVHERRVDSTNQRARDLAQSGAPHGTLVTASEQTSGRGRQGRAWVAPAGEALLMSLLVRGLDERSAVLPLTAAVAVCDALDALGASGCALKWPNDVWLEGRKAAGILIEGRPQEGWAVLGIGINVRSRDFPPELAGDATSLALSGADVTVEDTLERVLAALERWLGKTPATVVAAWRRRDGLLGRRIRWQQGTAVAAGIDDDGSLIARLPDGTEVKLDAGEVHLERGG
jgi:BirA family transcriptional regulator, biotin operon repressor / biotin---[acetyl-CoA-carboxylase] ligase